MRITGVEGEMLQDIRQDRGRIEAGLNRKRGKK